MRPRIVNSIFANYHKQFVQAKKTLEQKYRGCVIVIYSVDRNAHTGKATVKFSAESGIERTEIIQL